MKTTDIHLTLKPEQVKALKSMDGFSGTDLEKLGFSVDTAHDGVLMAMDAAPVPVTVPQVGAPVQFLQYWMPQAVEVMTAARSADILLGRTILGSWEDEEVVVKTVEHTGQVGVYSDISDIPLASYQFSYLKRQNVRFELAMQSGKLADMRASRAMINADQERRAAIARAFAINQNLVAFLGYNGTQTSPTYGLFNDPNLNAYLVEAGAKTFAQSTFVEITSRLNFWITTLTNQTGSNFNAQTQSFRLGIAPSAYNAMLTVMNNLGTMNVLDWFKKTYPLATVIPCNEMMGVNGGDDVAYLIVDELNGSPTVMQGVTAEMRLLGVEPKLKGTLEGYTSGTCGTIVMQPVGIVRATGV